jgi:hypothetical protein
MSDELQFVDFRNFTNQMPSPRQTESLSDITHSVQKRSLMYLSPPSQRIVTTTDPAGNSAARARAAVTLAPALTPTKSPSSRASLRVIAWAFFSGHLDRLIGQSRIKDARPFRCRQMFQPSNP